MTLTVDRPEAVAKPEEPEHVRSGILNWLTSTDHKVIGKSYLVTSFLFFCMAGCMAILIRTQLAAPDNTVVSQHAYDELFTMHGSLMLYLFAGPLAFGGLANYLVPLQVGAPDMAFPRLNALSYWLYLMGGLTMVGGFFTVGGAADRRRSLSQAVHRLPRSKQADQRPAAAPSGPDEEEDAVTMTETEALEAMLAHHRALDEHMGARAAAVGRAVASDVAYGPALADLVAYLADEVLPHALAEEHSIYQAAGARPDLADTVAEMTGEHRSLASAAEDLADAPNGPAAAARAGQIADLFGAHVRRENEVLLPALLADGGVDLAQLLVQMHRLTEAAQQESSFAEDASAPDTEALVLSLLLEAASELADTGRGDRACRLAASAWAALRVPRPELAVRVTAALHRLARRVAEEPVAFRSGDGRILGGGHHDAHLELDVRRARPCPAPRVDLRRLRRARPRGGLRPRQRPRPQAPSLPVRGRACRRLHLGLPRGGAGGVARAHRQASRRGTSTERGRRSRERGRARARRARSRARAAPRVDLRRLRRARPRGELRPRQRPRPEGASLPVRGPAPERVHLGLSGGGAEGVARPHRQAGRMSGVSSDLAELANREYQYGFVTDLETDLAPRRLSEDVVALISAKKGEPEWLLEWRLRAYRHWLTMTEPRWQNVTYGPIDYQDIIY